MTVSTNSSSTPVVNEYAESTLADVLSWNQRLLMQSFSLFENYSSTDDSSAYESLRQHMESVKENMDLANVLYAAAYKKKSEARARKALAKWVRNHISRRCATRQKRARKMRFFRPKDRVPCTTPSLNVIDIPTSLSPPDLPHSSISDSRQ